MGIPNDMLMCRLCGIKLEEGNSKYIFEESADLVQKINDTLPIRVSQDDHSKYICLYCYERVLDYYDFIQNVLEYSKDHVDTADINSLFEVNKNKEIKIVDISKIDSDMTYTCPNCNIALMVLITRNFEDYDHAFQISLAVVEQIKKLMIERNNHKSEDTMELVNICSNKSNAEYEFYESNHDIINNITNDDQRNTNIICGNSPILEEDINYIDTFITFQNRNESCEPSKDIKRKSQTNVSCEVNPAKSLKLETKLNAIECDVELLSNDYDCEDDSMRCKSISDDMESLDDETDFKEDNIAYITTMETEHINEDCTEYNDTDIKNPSKIVCDLCGTSYLSRMKYEFHMERHKLDKMDKYICIVCDKETSSENLLWDHYFHAHKSTLRYACEQCGKVFKKKPRLNSHQKRHKHFGSKEIHFEIGADETSVNQEQVAVNCSLCGKSITDLDPDAINDLVTCAACEDSILALMVDGYESKMISPRQYHCSMCPKRFVRKERLEFHEMRHNENMNEFICSTCSKEFRAENSLYEHYLFVHKGARPHICELCGKSFQLKARLKEHHRTHTGERPYRCDVCDLRCMTTNALRLHRKTHFSHNRYICKICNKSYSKKQNMNEHLEKHWKNDKNVSLPQLFKCPVCMEDLPTYRMLKYHMTETHQIDRQDPLITRQQPWHECNECHEKFKHQMSLKAHKERVHEGKVSPIFECDECKATYRIKQLLINHIKSKHGGEKRYKCAQCGKGFNDTKSLYNHILLHTGRKPFTCEYCNKSFRRKDSRDLHRRKHTGEQPYQCQDCGQSFSTYNNRSKHRKKEHGEGETECLECGKKCSQQEVRIHLNKHLGEKLNELQCS